MIVGRNEPENNDILDRTWRLAEYATTLKLFTTIIDRQLTNDDIRHLRSELILRRMAHLQEVKP